jgi:ABC-type multidrug transport system fused ATPase/permease subunit
VPLRSLPAALALTWRAHRAFAGQLAITMLAGLTPVAAAWLVRDILDMMVRGDRGRGLLTAVLLLAVAGGWQAVLPNAGQYLSAQTDRASQRRTTAGLFTAMDRMTGLRRLEDPGFHDRLNVALHSGSSAPAQIFTGGITIVQSVLTLAGFLVTLAVVVPGIAALVLVAAIPGLFSELDVSSGCFDKDGRYERRAQDTATAITKHDLKRFRDIKDPSSSWSGHRSCRWRRGEAGTFPDVIRRKNIKNYLTRPIIFC